MAGNFTIQGTDIDSFLIPRSYLVDRSPELAPGYVSMSKWGWGSNSYAQLGDGTTTGRSSPIQTVAAGSTWKFIGTSLKNINAIKSDGTLWMWGGNNYGGLGDNTIAIKGSPVQTVAGGSNWKQSSGGNGHTAAIKTDGTLWTWGLNTSGQLGNNGITNVSSPIQTVSGGTTWKQVSCGYNHTAAIKTGGTLWLWGANVNGRLGDNTQVAKSSPVQTVSGGSNWKLVAAGYSHTSSIKTDGSLWSWGSGSAGQLGSNSGSSNSSPVQTVAAGTNWKYVATSRNTVGAIKNDGTLWMWGDGQNAVLGINLTTGNMSSPVQTVASGTNWKKVAVGYAVTAGLKTDGTLWVWGTGSYGVLGNNTINGASSPVQTISGGTNWTDISTGLRSVSALRDDSYNPTSNVSFGFQINGTDLSGSFVPRSMFQEGNMWVWGVNDQGQLGANDLLHRSYPVQGIAPSITWKSVSTGSSSSHQAGIKSDLSLWIWGYNNYGQLGDNTVANKSSPVQTVAAGNVWVQVSTGGLHTIALKVDGTAWTWGKNNYGQLGNNGVTNVSSPVQTVAGGYNWKQVSAGDNSSAGIKTDGTLWVWGGNALFGNLGTNNLTHYSSPVQTVAGGTNWKQVSAGLISAAIKTDGRLWVWGANGAGGVGDGTTASKSSPVQTVAGGTNWRQVSMGGFGSAIKTDGTLWVWGQNSSGQLGTNDRTSTSSPVQTISAGTNWKTISAATSYMTAVKTDGTLWAWGQNVNGNLGDLSTSNKSSPVQTLSGGTNWTTVSVNGATVTGLISIV